jgi:WD40 repeat protein
MGRPERRLDPDAGPLQRFAYELRQLRQGAGGISYRQLARQAHYSATALSEAAGGEALPSLAVTLAYVEACGGSRDEWEARWRAVATQLEPGDDGTEATDTTAPYLGLATFQPEDASRYFGRQQLIGELLTRLAAKRFLAVFGASGSGKSSLLRAGLLPAVWAGRLPGSQQWETVLFTPGRHPLEETAIHVAALRGISPGSLHADLAANPGSLDLAIRQALANRSPATQLLLIVDQFEEVFTLCADEQERTAFVAALLGSVADSGRTRVVLGIRADFYSRCADYPALVTALRDAQVLIGPMTSDELRDVIIEPACAEGLRVEPALVATVVADVAGRPGALPLLSHALLETWQHRRGATMTLAGYEAAGEIRRAIGQTAERVFGQLSPEQQDIAKNVFLRLTALGEGTEDTSRRADRSELLTAADPATVQPVLDRLAHARLITLGTDSVEIAHEALIREWPRLRQWLTDDRDTLRLHRRLTEAATEWKDNGRDQEFLYRGTRLAAWLDRPQERLNQLERDFLKASSQFTARERSVARRRVRVGVSALALALILISALAVATVAQRNEAREQRDLALARQLATSAAAQLPIDPELSLLLARQAYAIRPIGEAEAVLRQATAESRVRRTLYGHEGPVNALAYSTDGQRIASAGEDGTVRIWVDKPGVLRHDGPVRDVAFSPDGRQLVTGTAEGTVWIWDTASETTLAVLRGHEGRVNSVAVSQDGQWVVSGGDDGTVRIWDVARKIPLAVLGGGDRPVSSVAFAPGGQRVATTGAFTLHVWEWAGEARLVLHRDHENPVEGVAFSPDGTRVATASTDGIVRIWTTAGGEDPVLLRGHLRVLGDIAFSRDGRRLASASDDGTARVWDLAGHDKPVVLRGHKGPVRGVAFHPDGQRVASTGHDGTVRIWDLTTGLDARVLHGHERSVGGVTLSPDARRLASASDDGTVRIWDLAGTRDPVVLRGHQAPVYVAVFSPDGRRVASTSDDGTLRVWDLSSGDAVVLRQERSVFDAAFSPDGQWLASAGGDSVVRVWDLTGPPAARELRGHTDRIYEVTFSPDGRWVASSSDDGTVRAWDLTGGSEPVLLAGHRGPVGGVAFSPDGRHVASAGHDGTARIWDLGRKTERIVLRGHEEPVNTVAFSPDGRHIVTGSGDATVRIWNSASSAPLVVFPGHDAAVYAAVFDPDGQQVISAGEDATIRLWRCEVCGPIEEVLALAEQRSTRTLTPDERAMFLPHS